MTACEHVRERLSDGAMSRDVADHLATCEDCRTYADALDTVLHHARTLAPEPPPGLSGRIVRDVLGREPARGGRQATAPTARPGPIPGGRWRRWLPSGEHLLRGALTGVATAAAVVLLVFAVNGGGLPGEGDAEAVLAAAVSDVRGGGSGFRFDVTGEAEIRHGDPAAIEPVTELIAARTASGVAVQEAPTFAPPTFAPPTFTPPELELPELELPDDLLPGEVADLRELTFGALCERLPAACAVDDGGLHPAEAARRYLEELQAVAGQATEGDDVHVALVHRLHLQVEFDRLGAPRDGAAGDATVGVSDVRVEFAGSGESNGRDASAYRLDWDATARAALSGRLGVATVDNRTWLRSELTAGWVLVDAVPAFHLGPVLAPHHLDHLLGYLEGPEGPVGHLGERDRGGRAERGFTVDLAGLRVEAWVGVADGRLHEVTWRHRSEAGDGTTASVRTTLRLRDHGAPVDVRPPRDWRPLSELPLRRYPPFWLDLGVVGGG